MSAVLSNWANWRFKVLVGKSDWAGWSALTKTLLKHGLEARKVFDKEKKWVKTFVLGDLKEKDRKEVTNHLKQHFLR